MEVIETGFHLQAFVGPDNNPDTVDAGEQFALTVRLTNDAGSVINEGAASNAFVTVTVLQAGSQPPQPGQGRLDNTRFQLLQGQRVMPEFYTFAEPITLEIQHELTDIAPASTERITVLPGAPAKLLLSSSPTWVRGNKHATVSARVNDAYDNGVPDQSMTFALVSGGGDLTPTDSLTDATGVAHADFHSAREPQVSRVRATSGALMKELDIETAFVDPSAPGGTIASYPNPFHPNEAPTTIAYKLDDNAHVTLRVFTLSGGLVLRQEFPMGETGGTAGMNEFVWDGKNGKGELVSSGGYIVVVEAQGTGETLHTMRRKIAVVR
jgi:Big-like domain-containing protein/flagellar hook capping protein FlgD